MRSLDIALEVSVWHNGKAVTPTGIVYSTRIYHEAESHISLHRGDPRQNFQIRLRWRSEIIDGWVSADMMLLDDRGAPIGGTKPTLIYLGPCDIATTTAFLCSWEEATPSMAGVWVVAVRAGDSIDTLEKRLQLAQGDTTPRNEE